MRKVAKYLEQVHSRHHRSTGPFLPESQFRNRVCSNSGIKQFHTFPMAIIPFPSKLAKHNTRTEKRTTKCASRHNDTLTILDGCEGCIGVDKVIVKSESAWTGVESTWGRRRSVPCCRHSRGRRRWSARKYRRPLNRGTMEAIVHIHVQTTDIGTLRSGRRTVDDVRLK
jgi:hypothetical protein